MLHTLKLLLPVLLPSWRFFAAIAPSPRIQYALLTSDEDEPNEWNEYRPRPGRLSFGCMLRRMFWNPRWNETLFVVSCAERLLAYPTRHSEDEILKRIVGDLQRGGPAALPASASHVRFRLLLVHREGGALRREVVFHSRIERFSMRDAA